MSNVKFCFISYRKKIQSQILFLGVLVTKLSAWSFLTALQSTCCTWPLLDVLLTLNYTNNTFIITILLCSYKSALYKLSASNNAAMAPWVTAKKINAKLLIHSKSPSLTRHGSGYVWTTLRGSCCIRRRRRLFAN